MAAKLSFWDASSRYCAYLLPCSPAPIVSHRGSSCFSTYWAGLRGLSYSEPAGFFWGAPFVALRCRSGVLVCGVCGGGGGVCGGVFSVCGWGGGLWVWLPPAAAVIALILIWRYYKH